MSMRKRKPTKIASVVEGKVIWERKVQSTYSRTQAILRELGGDKEQILRDLKWERMCKKAKALG